MAAKTGEKTATAAKAGASLSTPAAVVAGQAAAYWAVAGACWAVVAACRLAWLSYQRCPDQARLPGRDLSKSKSLAAAVVGLGLTRRRR